MTDRHPESVTRSSRVTGLVVGVVAALAVGAWLLVSATAFERSFSPAPLAEKALRADVAGAMEPWRREYTNRALVLDYWQRGARLLAAGDYNGAIAALDVAYRHDIGDQELLGLYRKAQATQAIATNRKAHLQHGHEGPGGTLTPGQVER